MISILIVDDDMNKISSIISTIKINYKDQIEIKQASNVQEALEILQNNDLHLLITDLFMPLRQGEDPTEKGGEILLREIYKSKNKASTPIYIVGLTQFEEVKHNFSGVWQVWKYDSGNEDWRNKLRDLIFHISRIDSKIVKEKKETIFVEGPTDKETLNLAFSIFFEEYKDKITIETISFGGGASWVERQLVIWGKTLFRKNEESYLQAIGLFDNDKAGYEAVELLKKQVHNDSAEYSTYSVFVLDKKYARHLIPAFYNGLKIPINIEEMAAPFCWEHAKDKNWLIQRNLSEELLEDPRKWDKTNQSMKEYIDTLSLTDEVNLFINNKINIEDKIVFTKYLHELSLEKQKDALSSFKPLLEEMLHKLKLK